MPPILIRVREGENKTKIGVVLFDVWTADCIDVDIGVVGPTVVTIIQFEKSGVIVTR